VPRDPHSSNPSALTRANAKAMLVANGRILTANLSGIAESYEDFVVKEAIAGFAATVCAPCVHQLRLIHSV
jgi:hypothetical protein